MKLEFLSYLLFLSRKKIRIVFLIGWNMIFLFFSQQKWGFFVLDWVIFFSARLIFNKTPKNKVQWENSLYSMYVKKIALQKSFFFLLTKLFFHLCVKSGEKFWWYNKIFFGKDTFFVCLFFTKYFSKISPGIFF